MQALIGYLVALTVFLGGGYAGVQWIKTPQDTPPAVEARRSSESTRSTRAKLLARRKHEAAVERAANTRPVDVAETAEDEKARLASGATSGIASVTRTPANGTSDNKTQQQSAVNFATREHIPKQEVASAPEMQRSTSALILSRDTTAKAAAIAGAAAILVEASAKPATTGRDVLSVAPEVPETPVQSVPVAKVRSIAARKLARIAERDDDDAGDDRTAVKRRNPAPKLSSRKPVLMILRTIEYPDGRREQRLLPMPGYRQALADY
jgi:hypothetical protein